MNICSTAIIKIVVIHVSPHQYIMHKLQPVGRFYLTSLRYVGSYNEILRIYAIIIRLWEVKKWEFWIISPLKYAHMVSESS